MKHMSDKIIILVDGKKVGEITKLSLIADERIRFDKIRISEAFNKSIK